jgi:hypothetical protein
MTPTSPATEQLGSSLWVQVLPNRRTVRVHRGDIADRA